MRRVNNQSRSPGPSDPAPGTSAIAVAVDLQALKAEAERAKGVVEFVPPIGDFIATDDPLFNLYSGACSVDEHRLRSSVAFGSESPWIKIPPLHFALSSTLGSRRSHQLLTIPPRACSQWINFIACCERRHLHTDELLVNPGNFVCFSGRQTGTILCISPSARSATAARTISRS